MASRPGTRLKIINVMVIIACVAVALGWLLTPGSESAAISAAIIALGLIVFWVVVILRIVELITGVRCPGCGQNHLERRSVDSFGERFFLCPDCGARCRRSLFGLLGPMFWQDASSQDYDIYYQKQKTSDPWSGPPGLEDEDETVVSKTHANLVKNKRMRRPENPNGPGLE